MPAVPYSPLKGFVRDRLPNGLRVLLKPDSTWPLVSAHAWVRVGSVDEAEAQAGISHILEHMVFKGTAHHRAMDISGWVESMGGVINAETAKEYTHYYIDVPSAGASRAIHLLGELLHRASLNRLEWKRECPVILEEIKRRNDDPDSLLWDLLNEAIFASPPLRRAVIGTPATVESVSSDDLTRFYRGHYTASRCVVAVSGDFKPSDMRGWIGREFGAMPAGHSPEARPQGTEGSPPRHIRVQKAVRQSYVAFGFPTPPSSHPDQEALDLIATILGDGRGARLVHTLREEKKLVWSVSAANLTHEGPGIFGIFAECDPRKRGAFTSALEQLLRRLRSHPPTAQEIERAKNVMQTSWLQSLESLHSQAATVGLFAMENHLDRLHQYLPRLLALNSRQIHAAVDRYFNLPLASAVIEA